MAIKQLDKDFSQLKQALKGVAFDPLRADGDTLMEGVVSGDELMKLARMLVDFFGAAVEPQDMESPRVRSLVDSRGGLQSGQTLYCCAAGEKYLFVMLWPWQDGKHTTVKAFCE